MLAPTWWLTNCWGIGQSLLTFVGTRNASGAQTYTFRHNIHETPTCIYKRISRKIKIKKIE